jgi:hypothetical protein
MPSYRPPSGPAKHEADGPSSVPFGVQLLAFLAGFLILLMAGKSVLEDYRLGYKLTHLDEIYEPVTATWLKVDTRRDAKDPDAHYPDVLFEYFVDGKSVWGWRLSLEERPSDSATWNARLAGYAVGDTVTAYVNPRDPKDSFVEKKTEPVNRLMTRAILGAAFGLFGGTLVVLALSGWLRKAARSGKAAKKKSRK